MALSKSSITEDLLVWLETDDAVKQDPEAMVLKRNLLEKLAAKKRQLSAVSKSSGYMLSNVDGGCKLVSASFESSRDGNSTFCAKSSFVTSTLRYKTELCRSFGESGYCRYGEKCQFAHGIAELRQTPRHPRYKTELCKAYHLNGFCPYGARCNFIHNDIDPIELDEVEKPFKQSASSVSGPVTRVAAVSTSGQSETGSHVTELPWPATKHALGSTADSPPQSVTDSPSPSPTAMLFDPAFDTFPIIWSAMVQPRMT